MKFGGLGRLPFPYFMVALLSCATANAFAGEASKIARPSSGLPEPGTALLGIGLVVLGLLARRSRA